MAQTTDARSKINKIKPVGWLALAVVALLVVSTLGLLVRPLLYPVKPYDLAELGGSGDDDVGQALPPTIAPPTATPAPVATPAGWATKTDFAGQEYLAPPPEVEQAVREAFEAVVACFILVGDPPEDDDAVLLEYQAAVQEKADQALAGDWVLGEWGCALYSVFTLPSEHWGPENPVRCQDHDTCTLGQAKVGPVSGSIIYYAELCQQARLEAPCLAVGSLIGEDPAPYQLYVATIERQEDGTWKVTEFRWETIPEPQ